MKRVSPQRLFKSLVASARRLDFRDHPASMHHSFAAKVCLWDEVKEVSGAVEWHHEVFHLQFALEKHTDSSQHRVIVFGRRLNPKNNAAPNTQRATFNSVNYDSATGYWIRPQILKKNVAQRNAFATLLPAGTLPYWDGERFRLGEGDSDELLARLLMVLQVVEQVKCAAAVELAARFPALPEVKIGDLCDFRQFQEGAAKLLSVRQRQRCGLLLNAARDYHRLRSCDGQLHCAACDWTPRVPVRTEIIQIHHIAPLKEYPRNGKSLSWNEAIANLQPLCPNCHCLLESHPDGGRYSLLTLRKALSSI